MDKDDTPAAKDPAEPLPAARESGDWKKGAGLALVASLALAGAVSWRLAGSDAGAWFSDLFAGEDAAAPSSGDPQIDALRAAAEAAPDNAEAWQQLGFALFARNLYTEAAAAYARATEAAPEAAVLWSSLGEARVMASEREPMPAAALQAFQRAAQLDPQDPRARYFLAVNKDLQGDHAGALTDWLALLADTPPGAPWETDLARTITQVGQREGLDVQARVDQALAARADLPQPAPAMAGIPGPTQEQLAAASSIPPSEQQEMAQQMVARLAARLEANPANVDGWIMLMRSHRQLGDDAAARAAYARAVQANPGATAQLREAAATLGLE